MSLRNDPENTMVLMPCAAAKIATDRPVPLFELYNGPLWQDLRANGADLTSNVFVLSGKYGFCSSWVHGRPYEEKISRQKVDEIIARGIHALTPPSKPGTMPGMSIFATVQRWGKPYTQVIVSGSGDYRRGFDAIIDQLLEAGVIQPGAPIAAAEGSILQQRKQFNEFLRAAQGIVETRKPQGEMAF